MQQREWTTQNFSRERKLQLLWRTVFCLPLLGLWTFSDRELSEVFWESRRKAEALLRARTSASTDLFSSIFQCASSRTTFPVCLWSLYSLHSMSPKQIKGQTRCLRLECLEPLFFLPLLPPDKWLNMTIFQKEWCHRRAMITLQTKAEWRPFGLESMVL